MKRHLLLALLLCTVALPIAAETWYEVELIVVAQRNPDVGNEIWPTKPLPPLPQDSLLTIPGPEQPAIAGKIAALPPENLRLTAEAQHIAADANYELLLHTGWRQPGLPRDQAPAIRLYAIDVPSSTAGTPDPAQETASAALPRLDGTVRLILSRYLHLETDLRYHEPQGTGLLSMFERQSAEAQPYRLSETRRMRSREVHYLDHPMFGVIALVTPYELAAAAPAPQPATPVPGSGTTGTIRR